MVVGMHKKACLLSHAFRDLPFDLTVDRQFSLFIVGAVGGSQNKAYYFFLPFYSSPLPREKNASSQVTILTNMIARMKINFATFFFGKNQKFALLS